MPEGQIVAPIPTTRPVCPARSGPQSASRHLRPPPRPATLRDRSCLVVVRRDRLPAGKRSGMPFAPYTSPVNDQIDLGKGGTMARLLVVITGADRLTLKDGTIMRTGFWAEEFVVPHERFRAAGIAWTSPLPAACSPPRPEELGARDEPRRTRGDRALQAVPRVARGPEAPPGAGRALPRRGRRLRRDLRARRPRADEGPGLLRSRWARSSNA